MNALTAIGVLGAMWVLATLWLAPLIRRTWKNGDLPRKVARAGALAVVDKVRDMSAAGVGVLSLVGLLLWISSILGHGAYGFPKSLIVSLTGLYEFVSGVATSYTEFLVWFGAIASVVGLLIVGRTAKARVAGVWTRRGQEVFKSILERPEAMAHWDTKDPDLIGRMKLFRQLVLQRNASAEPGEAGNAVNTDPAAILGLLKDIAVRRSAEELKAEGVFERPSSPSTGVGSTKFTWQTFVQAFAGPRLSKDLGLVNRWVSIILTASLVVSLLGWSAPALANSLRLAVNNIRVHATHADVDQVMNEMVSRTQTESAAPITEEQLGDLVRTMARATVHELNVSRMVARSADVTWPRSARSEFVRAEVLQRSMDRARPPHNPVERIRREVAARAGKGLPAEQARRFLQRVEGQIEPIVMGLQAQNPSAASRLAGALAARYGNVPDSAIGVQSNLIGTLVANSLGVLDVGGGDELDKLARTLTLDIGKAAVETWVTTQAKALVVDALESDTKPEVLRDLADRLRFETSQETKAFVLGLANATDSGLSPAKWEGRNTSKSDLIADGIRRVTESAQGRQATTMLPNYSQMFPNSPTVRIARAGTHEIGKALAMSFAQASRSFRTRGVLVGRDVEYVGPDVTSIQWIVTTDGVTTLLDLFAEVGGELLTIGRFPAGVVNQALRYAADGRVVAVTMVGGDENVVRLVTNLHPVLENTPLGCRILEADRFIDSFTIDQQSWFEETEEKSLDRIRQHRKAISAYMSAARIAEVSARRSCGGPEVQELIEDSPIALESLSSVAFRTNTSSFLANLDTALASSELVNDVFECLTSDPAMIGQCICSKVSRYDLEEPYWFPEDHTSQVREHDVGAVAGKDLLTPSSEPSEFFDLWLHTTFAVRRNGEVTDESTATPMDFPKHEIDLLNDVLLNGGIDAYVRKILRATGFEEFMVPIQQFVFLQRFFRMTFGGSLGEDFDTRRLVALERETASFVPTQVTLKWQPHSILTFMDFIESIPDLNLDPREYSTIGKDEGPVCNSASH